MNYQYLLYFKTTAEMLHFTRAASKLYITQPALSKAIKSLEEELGVPLFSNNRKKVQLTPFGEKFYEYVKNALDTIDQGVSATQALADSYRNHIAISALSSMYTLFLPTEVICYRKLHPDVRFTFEYKYTSGVISDILIGKADIGFCSNFDPIEENLPVSISPLYKESLCLIVSSTHPFAKRKKVRIADLKDEKFIVFYKSNRGTNKIIRELCSEEGFQPNIVEEGYNDLGVIALVASGIGIAVFPESELYQTHGIVKVRLDTDKPMEREIMVIWSRERLLSNHAAAFRDMLIKRAENGVISVPEV